MDDKSTSRPAGNAADRAAPETANSVRSGSSAELPIPRPASRRGARHGTGKHSSSPAAPARASKAERPIALPPRGPLPNSVGNGESKTTLLLGQQRLPASISADTDLPEINAGTVTPDSPLSLQATRKYVPGWLVSFGVHVVLLVTLALFGFSGNRDQAISLMASSETTPSLETLDEITLTLPSFETSEARIEAELQPPSQSPMGGMDSPVATSVTDAIFSNGGFSGLGTGFSSIAGSGVAMKPSEAAAARKAAAKDRAAEFFGLSARGNKFVYVLDCSGSMSGGRWEMTKRELFRSLDALEPEHRFLVLLYNGGTWAMFNTAPQNTFLVEATPENVSRLKKWMGLQFPGGSTFPRMAMASALSVSPDAIFLLSDGEFQDDTVEFLKFANLPADRGQGIPEKIPIHTLAMDFSLGVYSLRQIAVDSAGQFRMVQSN